MNVVLEIGFRFLPPYEQIISFFLKNKMIDDHTTTRHIREVDLLKHEPWQLPALSLVQSTYQEWLFFYKLNKIF
ncbi:TCV-interacting protein, Arabidopsis NAC domain containing protein 91 [Hibiscus trionum]|uniref:TCV-interacting protein, Arabidopsis NAC domain containing protein 91 n=1 Tax=Hibiscus trionum TaxID=183268 RepID=A0A9W7MFA1_HIBTR|nr:TCV-interacting protein, Arabidopsis NAC domain containing protein 91 [Hibiscus trionum]